MKSNVKKLSEFCDITSSKRIFASEYVEQGVPFYRGKEIIEFFSGALKVSTDLFISNEKYSEIKKKFDIPKVGDLLLTSVGTLGIPYIVKDDKAFYFKDGNLTWFRNFNGLDSCFLYYWLISPMGKEQLSKATIGSSQSAYTIKLLSSLDIKVPEIETQKKIASTLSHYDDLIQTNQQRIALLEEAAQRLYDEWFVKLRFPNYQQVPVVDGVPEGWEKVTLSKLVDLINGYPFKPSDLGEEGYPIIKIPELRNGVQATTPRNDGSQIPTKYFVHYGDIIFSWSGTILIDEWGYDKAILNQHLFNVVPYQKERKSFIRLAIQQAIPEMVGHAIGSTMMHLRRGTVDNYELLLPPEMLLNKFCVTVDNLFSQSSILKKQNQKLTQARDELLPRLMSGQLNVIL